SSGRAAGSNFVVGNARRGRWGNSPIGRGLVAPSWRPPLPEGSEDSPQTRHTSRSGGRCHQGQRTWRRDRVGDRRQDGERQGRPPFQRNGSIRAIAGRKARKIEGEAPGTGVLGGELEGEEAA